MTLRIAMWSGPRNISTALMRSFDSRADTAVSDEPLYAAYLRSTGKPHPMAKEIVATHESDWRKVAKALVGPVPLNRAVWYQKHMAHHLLPEMSRDWLVGLEHAFLIREPRAMLASLGNKLDEVRLEDTGLPQQVELFRQLQAQTGAPPPVIAARDLLRNPQSVLAQLCERLGLEFDQAMLSWEQGPRASDGCWGPSWYENTYASTGFGKYVARSVELAPELETLLGECETLFDELAEHRIQAEDGDS